ncbi:hypothetical protein FACS1894103_4710 [Campylobacterota bacterium]|nr:hypothetical protein FACS1894103_4710 [Campylobacterota bacterium]
MTEKEIAQARLALTKARKAGDATDALLSANAVITISALDERHLFVIADRSNSVEDMWEYRDYKAERNKLLNEIEKTKRAVNTQIEKNARARQALNFEKLINEKMPQLNEFLAQWKERVLPLLQKKMLMLIERLDEENQRYLDATQVKRSASQREEHTAIIKGINRDGGALLGSVRQLPKDHQDGFHLREAINSYLNDYIKQQKQMFVPKVLSITGDVEEARFNIDQNINGWVRGANGKASVKTIGAGGYNVQAYHLRWLFNKLKQDVQKNDCAGP